MNKNIFKILGLGVKASWDSSVLLKLVGIF